MIISSKYANLSNKNENNHTRIISKTGYEIPKETGLDL